jgi:hypothetical protein
MPPRKRYRCRYCGLELLAWLLVAKRPERSLLLHHLSQSHPDQVGPYLARMATEDIAPLAAPGPCAPSRAPLGLGGQAVDHRPPGPRYCSGPLRPRHL